MRSFSGVTRIGRICLQSGAPTSARTRAGLAGQLRAKLAQEPVGRDGPVRVLSTAAAWANMEKTLHEEMPELELHVNEPSTVGMKWLRQHIPAERIYIGLPPCLPAV